MELPDKTQNVPPPIETSAMAVTAVVLAGVAIIGSIVMVGLLFSIPAIILGHIALSRIRATNGIIRGKEAALSAIYIGYLSVGVSLVAGVMWTAILVPAYIQSRPPPELRPVLKELSKAGPEEAYKAVFKTCSEGRQAEAEKMLAFLVRKFPRDQRLAFFQAVCSRSRWNKTPSGWMLQRVQKMNSSSKEGRCAEYILRVDIGGKANMESGIESAKKIVQEYPDDPLLLWTLAIVCREYYKETDLTTFSHVGADAFAGLMTKFEVAPVLVHVTYANILSEELLRHEEALKHREIAVKLEPAAWTYEGLGNTLRNLKRYDESIAALTHAIALRPDDPDYYVSRGNTLRDANRFDESIAEYRIAAKLDPDDGTIRHAWGYSLDEQGNYKEAMAQYEIAARLGDHWAANNIGVLYENGQGVMKDSAKAKECYEKAVSMGNNQALKNLGDLYRDGDGVEKDEARALALYKKALSNGCQDALYAMGIVYEDATQVQRDKQKAVDLYEKAADAGSESGAWAAALMYHHGRGIKVDHKKAFTLFNRAVEMGYDDPMLNDYLAWCHYAGLGTEKNEQKAIEWWRKGADAGSIKCILLLADRYQRGEGLPRDMAIAVQLFQSGAAKGNESCMNSLAWLRATSSDVEYLDGKEAVEYALRLSSNNWTYVDTLAAAYARDGQFVKAVDTQQKAIELLRKKPAGRSKEKSERLEKDLKILEDRLSLYESGQAFVDNE